MTRLCKYCGLPFEPHTSRQLYCDRVHTTTCPICGKVSEVPKAKLTSLLKTGPVTCSYECRVKRTQATSLAKYGCKAPGNNPEARKKASETMMNNLGVPYAMMSADVQIRSKQTLVDKYGVDNAAKSAELVAKRMKTNAERYGDILPFNRPECYEKQHRTIMERYGVRYATELPHVHNWEGHVSKINQRFAELLSARGLTTEFELFIRGKYFDICLPTIQTVVEINPSYTHASIDHSGMTALYPNYHRDKTQLAEDNGYRCIHVWDWDDWDKVIDLIAPKIVLSSEDMSIYRLTPEVTNQFLNENDIHRTCRGQLVSFGLVKDEQVYQVMTFGKPKYDHSYNVQMMRMCTKRGFEITGGFDRLSHFASADYGLSRIIAYCDRSKYTGQEHEQLGMKLARVTPPQLVWSKDKKKITANLLRVHGYDQLFGTTHESDQSDDQLMLSNGWLPVYDCGQHVYVFD